MYKIIPMRRWFSIYKESQKGGKRRLISANITDRRDAEELAKDLGKRRITQKEVRRQSILGN